MVVPVARLLLPFLRCQLGGGHCQFEVDTLSRENRFLGPFALFLFLSTLRTNHVIVSSPRLVGKEGTIIITEQTELDVSLPCAHAAKRQDLASQ